MTEHATWGNPPENPVLGPEEVHVWLVVVDDGAARLDVLSRSLDSAETERAERFRFPRDRERFIVAHAGLRRILAAYLGRAAQDLRFTTDRYGKPSLARSGDTQDVRFNLSHSGNLVLCAVAPGSEVGVDVQDTGKSVAMDDIAQSFFSPAEAAALQQVPPEERRAAFYQCWVRKEAVIKGLGHGFSLPLNQFDVTVSPCEPPQLLDIRGDPSSANAWSLSDIAVPTGYAAALAVQGSARSVACWRWRARDPP